MVEGISSKDRNQFTPSLLMATILPNLTNSDKLKPLVLATALLQTAVSQLWLVLQCIKAAVIDAAVVEDVTQAGTRCISITWALYPVSAPFENQVSSTATPLIPLTPLPWCSI